MSRLQGETITIITRAGGGVDDDGYPIPEEIINRDIPGCVVIPEASGRIVDDDRNGEYRETSVLLPGQFPEVETGARIIVRELEYVVDKPPFHHISPFSTGRGGTEIYLRRATG